MLILSRRRGESVDVGERLRVTLRDFDESGVELEFHDRIQHKLLNVYRIAFNCYLESYKPDIYQEAHYADYGLTVMSLGIERGNRTQLRLGFEAPRHVHILRDNAKEARPREDVTREKANET